MDDDYGLFQCIGLESEAMLVDPDTLEIAPRVGELMERECGYAASEIRNDEMCWCNELAAHVVELAGLYPFPGPEVALRAFYDEWERVRIRAQEVGAVLLPGGNHPWMNPQSETVLWAHENRDWYTGFHEVFDCIRHGWANVQSTHMNLPYRSDAEFGILLGVVRVLLPIIPALSASTPYVEGHYRGLMSERMAAYGDRGGAALDCVSGDIVPEPVYDLTRYHAEILEPMYREVGKYDPSGSFRASWLNQRGAVARFDRNSVEIRAIDAQECPRADLAVVRAIWYVLEAMARGRWASVRAYQDVDSKLLIPLLNSVIQDGEKARVPDAYAELFGLRQVNAWEMWKYLIGDCVPGHSQFDEWYDVYEAKGPLARRLLRLAGWHATHDKLKVMCKRMVQCHEHDTFIGSSAVDSETVVMV